MSARTGFSLLLLVLMVCGCTQSLQPPVIRDTTRYQQQLATLGHWQLQGKIGVRHADRSDSAALQWKQDGEHFDIFLSGPLGTGTTQLIGTPVKTQLRNGDEQTSTDDPEGLIEQRLGWTLPLAKLPRWILGWTDNTQARFNEDHTLAGFSEAGWQIDYRQYQAVGSWLLPEKIILKHEDMQVTIVIKTWDLY